MRHIKDIKYANADDVILFMRDGESIPSGAAGWVCADLWLDKLSLEEAMNRRFADDVYLYEHERLQGFIMRPAPEMSYKEYKCKGKGSFLFLKDWESFRRFLGQGR
jgi:hypothetical protein